MTFCVRVRYGHQARSALMMAERQTACDLCQRQTACESPFQIKDGQDAALRRRICAAHEEVEREEGVVGASGGEVSSLSDGSGRTSFALFFFAMEAALALGMSMKARIIMIR